MAKVSAARSANPSSRAARAPSPRRAVPVAERDPGATPGSADLAGGLRTLLAEIDAEVRAVSALSEQIDDLVTALNAARDEQARRLLVLDTLRASVDDSSLGAFLDKAIRPRRTRVAELVPDRLVPPVS